MKLYYRGQRSIILNEIAKSPLMKIASVRERNAGTHFLLSVRTRLSEEEVRRAGLAADLSLSMYSDYSYSDVSGGDTCTLVINYAGDRAGENSGGSPPSGRYFSGVFWFCFIIEPE